MPKQAADSSGSICLILICRQIEHTPTVYWFKAETNVEITWEFLNKVEMHIQFFERKL